MELSLVQILVVVATILMKRSYSVSFHLAQTSVRAQRVELEGRSGEGFPVNGNQTGVSRS